MQNRLPKPIFSPVDELRRLRLPIVADSPQRNLSRTSRAVLPGRSVGRLFLSVYRKRGDFRFLLPILFRFVRWILSFFVVWLFLLRRQKYKNVSSFSIYANILTIYPFISVKNRIRSEYNVR